MTQNIFSLLLLSASLSNCIVRQTLNGQWTLVGTEAEITINNATVPGGVFSDLMKSGHINDIFYKNGDSDYRWVGLTEWTYSTQITVDQDLINYASINIVFEGLDTFATVTVNGVEVGKSENMFVRYVFNIKDRLKVGSNDIWVTFASPVRTAETLASNTSNEYVIPPECPAKEYNGICHANRIRKMQASFSWDWGPAFASVGIWKNVYLVAFNSNVIDYVLVDTKLIPDSNIWNLYITVYYFNGGLSDAITGELSAKMEHFMLSHQTDLATNEYGEFIDTDFLEIPVDEVKLWWPNGYGDQPLYNLTVTFTAENGETDTKVVHFGFRSVELVQEELEQGLSFYFKVNNVPIFAKGANEIPINVLPELGQDQETVRKVLQTVKDTNMNMLRVWGGGVYESDYFYSLADEFGIMIWQDFMFACAMYPADYEYLKIVREEVRHQLKRLGSHTSIALWAGNNENESALSSNWYNTSANFTLYKNDYIKLYVDVIDSEVRRILPNATFVTSSPTNGKESDQEGYVAKNPSDPLYGDVHFYDYKSDSWSPATFPVPRFASEYGYQSMPSVESWLTATDNLDDLKPGSAFLDNRQHHPEGNQQNLDLISLQLQLPEPSSENYVKAFIYYSQIVQAQSIKVETEHYRSFKGRVNGESKGRTMGALYWQLNDVWVAPTWSGMDFTGRWKMLQYHALDFFKSTIITGRINEEDQLEIYAICDLIEVPEDLKPKAMVHIYKWDSIEPLTMIEYPVVLDTSKAVLVNVIDIPTAFELVNCTKSDCFFHLHLMDQNDNNIVPFNYVFPEKLKNSNIPNANLQIESIIASDEEGKIFTITLGTDVVALFVWLDSHEVMGRFSENGFLQVFPSKTVTFVAEEPTSVEELSKILTVTHLRDPAYF